MVSSVCWNDNISDRWPSESTASGFFAFKHPHNEMDELMKLPGKAFRETPTSKIVNPDDALKLAGAHGPMTGLDPAKMPGIVVDDETATVTGKSGPAPESVS